MAPTLAVRHSIGVLRTAFDQMRLLIEAHCPDSMERRAALADLRAAMEVALRGVLDQTNGRVE